MVVHLYLLLCASWFRSSLPNAAYILYTADLSDLVATHDLNIHWYADDSCICVVDGRTG